VEALAEALRWAGRVETTGGDHEERLNVLSSGLSHRSPIVRDGATVGLGHLNDPIALAYLRSAIMRETIPELREDIEDIAASIGE
jgi:hypothetical protein